MKKFLFLLVTLACIAVSNNSYAQQRQKVDAVNRPTQKAATKSSSSALIPKGSMIIGGSAGFDMQFEDGNNSSILYLSPQFGYFLTDNLALGAAISFTKVKDVDPVFGFGPFARYYLNNGLFGQLQYEFQSQPTFLDERINGSAAGLGVGYALFLNNSISLEPLVYYKRHFGDLGEYNQVGLQVGISAYLGR